MVLVVDDEHFPELGRQLVVLAHEVDQVADGQVLGHRDQLALHQAAGGFLRIGQRAFDRRAVFRLHLGEDRLLVRVVEVLDQLDRVVGIELLGDFGHRFGRQGLDHVLADVVVEFGDDLAGHQVGDGRSQRAALVGFEQFEQVGDVGRVERLDQFVGARVIRRPPARRARYGRMRASAGSPRRAVRLLGRGGGIGLQLVEIGFGHGRFPMRQDRKSKRRVTSALSRPISARNRKQENDTMADEP